MHSPTKTTDLTRLPLAGLLAGLLLPAGLASAAIRSTTGQIQVIDKPASVHHGDLASDQHIHAFVESTNVTLDVPLALDSANVGVTMRHGQRLHTGIVPQGRNIDTVFLHLDLHGNRASKRRAVQFELIFERPIVGLIYVGDSRRNRLAGESLDASDWVNPDTLYPDADDRRSRGSLDAGKRRREFIAVSPDGLTLRARISAHGDRVDQIRIVLASDGGPGPDGPGPDGPPVPTPGAAGLLLIAGLAASRRRRLTRG